MDRESISGAEIERSWVDFFADAASGCAYPRAVCYVHIPFCTSKCSYCECTSLPLSSAAQLQRYREALIKEIRLAGEFAKGHRFEALYVGGGTPSLLADVDLDELLSVLSVAFSWSEACHFCCEMNPDSVTASKIRVLEQHGCNRVSLGVQSFEPSVLKGVGRGYQTTDNVERAAAAVRSAGRMALNLDLVAGLPGDTPETFAASIAKAINLCPDSLVIYPWTLARTPLQAYGFAPHRLADAARDELLRIAAATIEERRPAAASRANPIGKFTPRAWLWNDSPDAHNSYAFLKEQLCASVLGLGFGAESKIHGRLIADHGKSLHAWEQSVSEGNLPAGGGKRLTIQLEQELYAARFLGSASEEYLDRFRAIFGADAAIVFAEHLPRVANRRPAEEAQHSSCDLSFLDVRTRGKCVSAAGRLPVVEPPGRVARQPAMDRPDALSLQVATRCNCRCVTCAWRFGDREIPTSQLLQALSDGRSRGCRSLDILGPEPSLDPRLPALARKARALGFDDLTCWSNGRRFAYLPFAKAISASGFDSVVVSLHGPDAAVHDQLVGARGAFEQTSTGIHNLVGVLTRPLIVRIVVSEASLEHMPATISLVENMNVQRLLLDFSSAVTCSQLTEIHETLLRCSMEFRCFHRHGPPDAT